MKKIATVFLFSLMQFTGQAQSIVVDRQQIEKKEYKQVTALLKKQRITNEKITIETNPNGQITAVDSKQEKLKKLLLNRQLIPVLNDQNELIATSALINIQDNQINEWQIINLKKEKVRGQLYTAARLKTYIDQQEYEAAIHLFSKNQQEKLMKLKLDEDSFRFWISAWTMDETKWLKYAKQIIKGNGIFVYEDDEWKIDEK
ncbi:MAG: hypothetical protein ACKO5C_04615 [Ferruginibacter sp.]